MHVGEKGSVNDRGVSRDGAVPDEETSRLSIVLVKGSRTEGIGTESVTEGRETGISFKPEGVRRGCVEGCRDTGLISSRTKASLQYRKAESKMRVMTACILLGSLFETVEGAKGSSNGTVHNLSMRF